MKREVLITVRGEQRGADGETDTTEQTARGTLEKTAEGWTITYEETEPHVPAPTRTTLTVEEGRAVLSRSGGLRTHMVFVPGESHSALYELAFGGFPMEVSTHALKFRLTERGGVGEIRYALTLAQQGGATENRMKLHVRSIEPAES